MDYFEMKHYQATEKCAKFSDWIKNLCCLSSRFEGRTKQL